ncbi:MAG TPA: hypothetical protein VLM89_07130 [Phycisphaerae bacterium]|nr:hypothetical protein [Phycisphaerae bacterium]
MVIRRSFIGTVLAGVLFAAPGCILGNRPNLVRVGSRDDQVTFYLDGAGNYGFGKETVPLGLADGGYQGHFQHYIWTTYLGIVMDQISVSHNRREGRRLAGRIQKFLDDHPDSEVNLIGLSAGTGVIVFALEALEPKYKVQNVVMLSSSLSCDYDLTVALRHVDGGIYFLWSPDDPILRGVVPIVGTVDRSSRDIAPAGTWGVRLPFGASKATRQLYGDKVHNIRWYTEPLIGPVKLRHAGSVSRPVIRDLVAPILVHQSRFVRKPEPEPEPDHELSGPTRNSGSVETPSHLISPKPATPPATQPSAADRPGAQRSSANPSALITVGTPTKEPDRSIASPRPAPTRPVSP